MRPYVEFAPDVSEITAMPLAATYDNLMILRGVSKFYAAPGLRLGYGVTSNQAFLDTLKKHQNPWSLNSLGAYAACACCRTKILFRKRVP